MNQQLPAPLPTAAEAAIARGRILEAIEIIRETEGLGLTEAKARVDVYIAQDPELRNRIALQRRAMRVTIVKRSRSGICHDWHSANFKKTEHYTAYRTMEDCVKSSRKEAK
jgi:hypothetical protein